MFIYQLYVLFPTAHLSSQRYLVGSTLWRIRPVANCPFSRLFKLRISIRFD